jgi:hypothetical protein
MKKHVKEVGHGFELSMAVTLTVIAEAINSPDASANGQARAGRVLGEVIAAGRAERFEQIDILETMVSTGAEVTRMFPLFDALVMRVGVPAVADIIRKELQAVPRGGAS